MKNPLKALYTSAVVWMVLGLAAGVFYREFTRGVEGGGVDTQLATLHTHLLVLGVVFSLLFLLLERSFALSEHKRYSVFFYTWQGGVGLVTLMMLIKGSLQVLGSEAANSAALSGISGIGHIVLTVGAVFFFICLGGRLKAVSK